MRIHVTVGAGICSHLVVTLLIGAGILVIHRETVTLERIIKQQSAAEAPCAGALDGGGKYRIVISPLDDFPRTSVHVIFTESERGK